MSYDKNNPTKFKWGGQVDWRDPSVHGVKLLLDPDQPKPIYLPASSFKKDRKDLPKSPVDVAADFIGAMYQHAISIIESSVIREYFKLCHKDFVLSVPAVWSDKAKDLTIMVTLISGSLTQARIGSDLPIKTPGCEEGGYPTRHTDQGARGRCFVHLINPRPLDQGEFDAIL